MKVVKISSEFITLGQLLKFADIVSTGGMVKPFLETAEIYVENEFDVRRGRKIYPGMVVKIKGHGDIKVESI